MSTALASPAVRLATAAVLLAAVATAAAVIGGPSPAGLEQAFAGSGLAGAAAFSLLYAALTVLMLPGSTLAVAAGVLYGLAGGVAVSVAGATAGATVSFLIGRRLSRGSMQALAGPRLAAIDAALGRQGLKAVLAVRLVPLFPFNLVNYAFGATAVTTRDYVVGTALGIVPGAIARVALGDSLHRPGSAQFIGAAILTIALVAVGAVLAARSRRSADPCPADDAA